MYYTEKTHKGYSALGEVGCVEQTHSAFGHTNTKAVGTLTNYKRDVDKDDTLEIKARHAIVHYGLSKNDLNLTTEKLQKQKQFLDFSFIYDRISHNKIPLSDIFISANHAPERYYAEIQNRVNTLTTLAKERNLQALFMTITLPSQYHKQKQLSRGKNKNILIDNPKYNGTTPKESVKELTKMFARLRHDRALKDGLTKEDRIYFRVNEPTKSGTPHTHILMFVPVDRVERVKKAFKRLFDERANDIQDDIKNAASYVMKYINKTLPLSKAENLSEKDKYLNAWYSKHRIIRFHSSRTLAPLNIYRLMYNRFSMYALTRLLNEKHLSVYVEIETDKVMEIIDEWGDVLYSRGSNYDVVTVASVSKGDYFSNNSQTSESAIGVSA